MSATPHERSDERKGAGREPPSKAASRLSWNQLLTVGDFAALRRRLRALSSDDFEAWAQLVAEQVRAVPDQAAKVSAHLLEWAREWGDPVALAYAQRAAGNVADQRGDYAPAIEAYREALRLFASAGSGWERQRGRVHSGMILPLGMLGDIEGARREYEAARLLFEGDANKLGRVEINFAWILIREDDYNGTLAALKRAEEYLQGSDDPEALVAIACNRALAHQNRAVFDEAEAAYSEARRLALANNMPKLAAQCDYNVAYVYFLRGQHIKAIHMMDHAREVMREFGDKNHLALCDYDQSDICIELNLYEDALQYATAAMEQFRALGIPYDQGRALLNMAVAEHAGGRAEDALALLVQAHECFERSGSEFFVHMTNLQRAVVMTGLKRSYEAIPIADRARAFFARRDTPTKLVNAGIVAARARLEAGDLDAARRIATQVESELGDLPTPWLHVGLQTLLGDLADGRGDRAAALAAYERAMDQAEATRGDIRYEEMRISFMRNKAPLYENYLAVMMQEPSAVPPERVWRHMERAKSRSLAETMAGATSAIQPHSEAGGNIVHEIARLREELNWFYRQLAGDARVRENLAAIHERERDLMRALRQVHDERFRLLEPESLASLERVRAALAGATLIEFFPCGDGFVAIVADADSIHTVRLPRHRSEIEGALRLLRFQVGKRAMRIEHFERFAGQFLAAANSHLTLLYDSLIAPLRHLLRTPRLVIVPHGVLHALPFAALHDGNRALIDDFSFSVAPSAAVLALSCERAPSPFPNWLLIAAEPAAAADEVRAVSSAWPGALILEGPAASLVAFRQAAETSRAIHIAAHGVYRADNPNFSALELADGRLNVIDLHNLRLHADCVVLSGCGTALGDLAGGDEVIGLTRGFLYAGARSVVSSLWDVDDRNTAEFMTRFYEHVRELPGPEALRQTSLEFRARLKHPFFWASFQWVGAHQ